VEECERVSFPYFWVVERVSKKSADVNENTLSMIGGRKKEWIDGLVRFNLQKFID
jgi:hypothetical protein